MLKGVRLVSIPVRDQDKALDFYTKKLGFSILTDQPFDGKQRWIELSMPGSDTPRSLHSKRPGGSHRHLLEHRLLQRQRPANLRAAEVPRR